MRGIVKPNSAARQLGGLAFAVLLLCFQVFDGQRAGALSVDGGGAIIDTVKTEQRLSNGPVGWLSSSNVMNYETISYAAFMPAPVDCGIEACVALTFDDGPDLVTTPQVLDELAKINAHATFFVVGNRVAQGADILRRMKLSGHEVENHSWSHADMTELTNTQIREQVEKTQQAIAEIGLPAPRFFRPPYEMRNDRVRKAVGMPFILWNIDTQDWRQKNSRMLASSITEQARPGSIILLHDIKPNTVRALPKILDELKGKYHFVTVQELLNLPMSAKGEFTSR